MVPRSRDDGTGCSSKGLAIETTLQDRLEELRGEFSALQQLAHQDPVRLQELFPQAVADLQRSLEELKSVSATLTWESNGVLHAPKRSNGHPPRASRPAHRDARADDEPKHAANTTRIAFEHEIALVLLRSAGLEDVVPQVLRIVCERLGWDAAELRIADGADHTSERVQCWPAREVGAGAPDALADFAEGAEPCWVADIALDARQPQQAGSSNAGMHGMLCLSIPLLGGARATLRVFCGAVRPRDGFIVELMTSVAVELGYFLERALDQERLRASETRKSAILDAALDAVITVDSQGLVIEFNSAASAIFGYRREDAIGHPLVELVLPERVRASALSVFEGFRESGKGCWLGERFETDAIRADGTEFSVEVALLAVRTDGWPLLTIYANDTSARRRAEHEASLSKERLRSLMADVLLAEEGERRRLAVDLHDGLSQTIALTRIKLAALRRSMDGKLGAALDEIERLVDQTNLTARSISFELSPPVLHDFGLEPALQWLVENIQMRYGIQIELEDDGEPKPADQKTRVILFRSIRELLINAAKHAGARRVNVRLRRDEGQLDAFVEDDGVGMDPRVIALKGSGLISIRERLTHVGGSMRIESKPGRGTTIRLRAPISNGRLAEVEA